MKASKSWTESGAVRRGMALLFLLSFAAAASAQLTTATISGVVKDSTGAVVPGATVTVMNSETGLTRSSNTAGDGAYKFPALPVGTYEVRGEHTGFQRALRNGLNLSVGQDAVINLTLEVGAVEQTVAVTAEAPLIETTTANVSGLVGESEVRDLPLNARNLVELAALFPGITMDKGAGGSVSKGFATKLAIVGTRYNANLFQLDGQDINDNTGSSGGAAGILMGVETVREFNVITSGYSAEYGKHTGGIFNAITKSGGNSLHGSVFEFLRNNKLDARNFFDGATAPPYKRNQYGFALGGPIRKDRTFFFGSYEALKERLGVTQTYSVPDAGARQGILPNPATGQVQTIAVVPAVKPFLDSYPLPNGRNFQNGIGEFVRAQSLATNENFFTVRVDHTLSAKDSLFGRYMFDDAGRSMEQSFNTHNNNATRFQYAALGETRLFSPQVINVFLMGFKRSVLEQVQSAIEGFTFPQRSFTTFADGFGNLTVTGLSVWGGSTTYPSRSVLNEYQVKDDVYYTVGKHSFKFGFDRQRMQFYRLSSSGYGGQFTFTSLSNFMQGTVNQFNGLTADSIPANYTRQTLYGLFAQDDIRASQKLTFNLGLRYEFLTSVHVPGDRVANMHDVYKPGLTLADLTIGNPMFLNPSLKNWAPRFGFAWDPFGTGKTSVRGGIGVFFDQVLPGIQSLSFTGSPPFTNQAFLFATDRPSFPDALIKQGSSASTGAPALEPIQYHLKQPTIYKYSMDIQRSITRNTSVEAGFAATRGVHLVRATLVNTPTAQVVNGRMFIPSNAPLIDPAIGRFRSHISDATSDYFGYRMQVTQRLSHGLMGRLSYTYSKVIDDGTNFAGSTDWSNSPGQSRYRALKDTALSPFDIRQALTANFNYDLPGNNLAGPVGKLVGGWQVSGIVTAQTGQPFTITSGAPPTWMAAGFIGDYPDLVAGSHVQYHTRNVDHYFDPSAFTLQAPGIIGNLARDFGTAPGIMKVDLVLVKNTHLTERLNLQFRSEFFNLFNRANFGVPNKAVFDARTLRANPAIGRIVDTSTTSRQIQFGMKVEF